MEQGSRARRCGIGRVAASKPVLTFPPLAVSLFLSHRFRLHFTTIKSRTEAPSSIYTLEYWTFLYSQEHLNLLTSKCKHSPNPWCDVQAWVLTCAKSLKDGVQIDFFYRPGRPCLKRCSRSTRLHRVQVCPCSFHQSSKELMFFHGYFFSYGTIDWMHPIYEDKQCGYISIVVNSALTESPPVQIPSLTLSATLSPWSQASPVVWTSTITSM